MVGTPYYMAPEVVDNTYTERCYIWSLGVLAYVLLTGFLPFAGDSRKDIHRQAKHRKLSFPPGKMLSEQAKDLVTKMLSKLPSQRPSAKSCLAHEFFSEKPKSSEEMTFSDLVHTEEESIAELKSMRKNLHRDKRRRKACA